MTNQQSNQQPKLKSSSSLDPLSFVQLPRPDAYIPNPAGTHAFCFVSVYKHELRRSIKSLQLIELKSTTAPAEKQHTVLLDHLTDSEALWLNDSTLLYRITTDLEPSLDSKPANKALKIHVDAIPEGGRKSIELWALTLPSNSEDEPDTYLVGSFPTTISGLKSLSLSSSQAFLAFFADVYAPYDDQAFLDVQKVEAKFKEVDDGSSGRTYDTLFARHWDRWMDSHGKSSRVYFTQLNFESKWSLSSDQSVRSPFPNLTVPGGPQGDNSDFDLSGSSIVVTAKDPNLNPAWHTRQNVYLAPLFPKHKDDARVLELTLGDQGATSSPVFSPLATSSDARDVGKLAWLEMKMDGYESDQNKVIVYDLATRQRYSIAQDWDRSPNRIIWGKDDDELFVLAEDHGRVKVFRLSVPERSEAIPECLTNEGSVSTLFHLSNSSSLLLTVSSLSSPNVAHMLSLKDDGVRSLELASLFSHYAELDKGETFWFEGAEGANVHGLLVRPPRFEDHPNQKWPLLFLIHGGPQSAWNEAWSWRWNANAFASAGYIVAMINPSGSTGFGQEFTDSINENWGGKPFKDLAAGYQYLLEHFPIDRSRTAALGGSYGGYMVNWLMGHNTAPFDFKAFVSHDGIFNTISAWAAADELYFPEHDLRGCPIRNRAGYEKWNPLNFVSQWKTPALVIHSQFDYRLPESEGLSVFNCLQRYGVPSRLLYFPDENHWVCKPANSMRWYREIFDFLKQWCPPGPFNEESHQ
ncbi:hypothetical protein CROQUDRAFT_661475 [Cronartium quercuum f. sp. fusiforme G11]|uniref:Dipeptidyl-peptidase V n=1 Tax=Cronartium quercuum f. sp. fusiforme G11 TaxID=708437 RepID=A0A9P6NGM5_9BASI|nr:hypothetical protein CROQUDRAFT_661475 [Cronartium quercuum f. sp. fusiforme G11]